MRKWLLLAIWVLIASSMVVVPLLSEGPHRDRQPRVIAMSRAPLRFGSAWDLSTGAAPPNGLAANDMFAIGRPPTLNGQSMSPYAVSLQNLSQWIATTLALQSASTYAAGTAAGQIPVLGNGGALPDSVMPADVQALLSSSGGAGNGTGTGGVDATARAAAATAQATANAAIPASSLGQPNGPAKLTASGLIPVGAIDPASVATDSTARSAASTAQNAASSAQSAAAAAIPSSALGQAKGPAQLDSAGNLTSNNVAVGGTTVPLGSIGSLAESALQPNTAITPSSVSTGSSVISMPSSQVQGGIGQEIDRTIAANQNPGNPAAFVKSINNSTTYQPYYGSIYLAIPTLRADTYNMPGANGSVAGVQSNLYSQGNNPFASEDLAFDGHVYRSGHNSTWIFNGEIDDSTGLPPDSFSAQGAELDILANGPDTAASLYDPSASRRWLVYLAPKVYPMGNWAEMRVVATGTLIVEPNPSGVNSVYIATTGGTSGTTQPTWPASGTVADGSVTWTYGEPYNMSVGTGIWLDNGENTGAVSYNTGIGTNGVYRDAIIDFSEAQLATGAAAIRLAANMPIDLSANGTAAGQNKHVLQYSSTYGQLAYGVAAAAAGSPLVTELEIDDAMGWTKVHAPFTGGLYNCAGLSSGLPTTGTTLCWNETNAGQESDLITGQGGLNIYPVSSTGTIPSAPIFTISPGGTVGIAGGENVSGNVTNSGTTQQAGGIPVTVQTGNYTIQPGDCGKKIWDFGATAAHTYTIPTGLPACQIDIMEDTANALTIAGASGEQVMPPPGSATPATLSGAGAHARIDVMTTTVAFLH